MLYLFLYLIALLVVLVGFNVLLVRAIRRQRQRDAADREHRPRR
jgi:hypothetical protein